MAGWLTEVRFDDGLIAYGCWQTSTDSMWAGLMAAKPDWPTPRFWNDCSCGKDEAVVLFCLIHPGTWEGRACRHCMALTEGRGGWPEDGGEPLVGYVECEAPPWLG